MTSVSLSGSFQEGCSLKEMLPLRTLKKKNKLFHVYIDHLLLSLSKNATDVKVTADTVKEALEEAEKAQIAAEKAIKLAVEDIQGTQNLLTSVRG